jgi:hypothetical protein
VDDLTLSKLQAGLYKTAFWISRNAYVSVVGMVGESLVSIRTIEGEEYDVPADDLRDFAL